MRTSNLFRTPLSPLALARGLQVKTSTLHPTLYTLNSKPFDFHCHLQMNDDDEVNEDDPDIIFAVQVRKGAKASNGGTPIIVFAAQAC